MRVAVAAVAVAALVVVVFAAFKLAGPNDAKPRPGIVAFGNPKLVSYYPAKHPWAAMWTSFDVNEIKDDFARAHATGFDTVRIFLPPKVMGFPQPSTPMRTELAQVIQAAKDAHLKVGLSLFDRYSSYKDLEGSDEWLHEILKPYRGHPEIAFVELRNELDPGDSGAMPWLRHMVASTRQEAPRTPILVSTPGRLGPGAVKRMARGLRSAPADAYGLHYYGSPALLTSVLESARKGIAPARLYLGEIGYSTSPQNPATPGLPGTQAAQEEQQVVVFSSAFAATRAAGLPSPGLWTLTDFDDRANPPDANGAQAVLERKYGLYREDGTAKPSASVVRGYFTVGGGVSTSLGSFSRSDGTTGIPLPLGWRIFGLGAGTFSWDGTVGHDAPGSAKLSATLPITSTSVDSDASIVPSFYISPAGVHVQPGRSFSAVVWARGEDVTGSNRISLSFFDSSGRFLFQRESADLPQGTTNWTRLVVSAVAPKRAASLQLHLKSSGNDGSVWFDDASVD